MSIDYCQQTGKVIYTSRSDAARALVKINQNIRKRNRTTTPTSLHPYKCEFCDQFHIGRFDSRRMKRK